MTVLPFSCSGLLYCWIQLFIDTLGSGRNRLKSISSKHDSVTRLRESLTILTSHAFDTGDPFRHEDSLELSFFLVLLELVIYLVNQPNEELVRILVIFP